MKNDDFKRALSEANKQNLRKYVCKADGYAVTYDPLKEVATYNFEGKQVTLKNFSEQKVERLVKSAYWIISK